MATKKCFRLFFLLEGSYGGNRMRIRRFDEVFLSTFRRLSRRGVERVLFFTATARPIFCRGPIRCFCLRGNQAQRRVGRQRARGLQGTLGCTAFSCFSFSSPAHTQSLCKLLIISLLLVGVGTALQGTRLAWQQKARPAALDRRMRG